MKTTKLYKSIALILGLLLITGLLGPAMPVSSYSALHAQPALIRMADDNPDQSVSVIIQKMGGAADVEDQVRGLGGIITRDLNMIDAFSAEMTAGTAVEMARSAGVRWISLDAPVQSTACAQCVDTSNLTNA